MYNSFFEGLNAAHELISGELYNPP
jgi:hypothetical protein